MNVSRNALGRRVAPRASIPQIRRLPMAGTRPAFAGQGLVIPESTTLLENVQTTVPQTITPQQIVPVASQPIFRRPKGKSFGFLSGRE